MLLKEEKLKYVETDIFLDTILESVTSNYGIKNILGVKIRDIILRGELINDLRVKEDISNSEISLLDLDEFNNIELSFEEQKDLKTALEKRIREKHDSFLQNLNELTDSDAHSLQEIINHVKFDAESERKNVLVLQNQLIDHQKSLVTAMHNLGERLHELVNTKTQTAPKVAEQKAIEISTECEKFNLRYRIMHQQQRLSIFEELPISMDAYRNAISNLKEQQEEISQEIEQIRGQIEIYKIVSRNEEYQETLKDYKQYKKSIENKLWIYNERKVLV
ncbi:hypothetical protein CBL_11102 [Carabus blaptoides fortunei]